MKYILNVVLLQLRAESPMVQEHVCSCEGGITLPMASHLLGVIVVHGVRGCDCRAILQYGHLRNIGGHPQDFNFSKH